VNLRKFLIFVYLCNGLELDVNRPYWRLNYLLKSRSMNTHKLLIVGTFCIIEIKLVLRENLAFSLVFD